MSTRTKCDILKAAIRYTLTNKLVIEEVSSCERRKILTSFPEPWYSGIPVMVQKFLFEDEKTNGVTWTKNFVLSL